MSSPLDGKKAKRVIPGQTCTGYDEKGIAQYKEHPLVEIEAYEDMRSDTWIGTTEYELFTHLLERINKLEETNRLLCKALGIRRNRNVKKSSS